MRTSESGFISQFKEGTVTYDHRLKRIGHPVRSAIHKLQIGGLVVGWVTTSESPLLYASFCFFGSSCSESTHLLKTAIFDLAKYIQQKDPKERFPSNTVHAAHAPRP
ncbi:hypothetical protein OCU04_007079 [Sclerotinia nivalis]|uniref:Uncharacterized protein n=1 Tax=Sclerotinia nivalis TaxID=352851 RepID=A0A9X0AL35_9HELO|nr:hypothetical protein OCU04_007079 [Sclerotinia nivalis]